jgi:hypothetical protein
MRQTLRCYVWWWMYCRYRMSQMDGCTATARGVARCSSHGHAWRGWTRSWRRYYDCTGRSFTYRNCSADGMHARPYIQHAARTEL